MKQIREKRNANHGGKKGLTAIELIISAGILAILTVSVYSLLSAANVISRTNDIYHRLNQDAMQTLRYFSREIGQTSPTVSPSHLVITADGNGNSIVRLQMPVDWDNDGDVVVNNVTNATEWGAYDEAGQMQNGRLGAWVRYSVVNNQLIREVLTAGLNLIPGLSRVVANNVQTFSVVQNLNVAQLSITLAATDAATARNPRTFQATFSNSTVLRNAVN